MSAEEELRFSLRADVPKENIQVLDNVLNELFGSLSSKMKQAGEFLDAVKMRPPRNSLDAEQTETEKDEKHTENPSETESNSDSDMPDLVSDSEEDEEENLESDSGNESDSENYADDESEIDHIFLILIDGRTAGYSTTLRGAMQAADEVYGEFTATYQGSFRLERTPTSLRVYRRTPYLWFLFAEQLALQVDIQVVTKV